jgi:enolase
MIVESKMRVSPSTSAGTRPAGFTLAMDAAVSGRSSPMTRSVKGACVCFSATHGRIDLQDFMFVPVGAPDWPTALRWCTAVYRAAGDLLNEAGRLKGVADEGGFFPELEGNAAALEPHRRHRASRASPGA